MPIINKPGRGGGGSGSSTPAKALLDYEYDDTSTVVAAPGAGKFRLTDPDLTQATNTVVIDHITKNSINASGVLDSPPILEESLLILEGGATGNVFVGRVTAITVDVDFTSVDVARVSSSAAFTAAETVKITYATDGNVTFNPVTGNLEVGGVSIGDPADISQQFFKYKFDSATNVTSIPLGTFRLSNADPKLATTGWLTNRIDETDVINISATMGLLAPGSIMFVRAKNAVHMALFRIQSVANFTEGSVTGKTFTFVSPGAVDGIQFTDEEEVYVNFFGLGNFIYDTTTKEGSVNGVQVTGQNIVADFASLPDPTDADNDNEVYKVSNPGIWVECDGVADAWVPFNGLARLYRNASPIKSTAPATVASAIANNGSGKVRVTAAAHLMTNAQDNFEVYVSSWAGTGVAGRYRVTYVDANNYDLPDLNYNVGLGLPTVALCKGGSEKILIAEIDLPPLTSKAVIRLISSSIYTDSAEDKRLIWSLMTAARADEEILNNRNDTAATNTGLITNWGFRNLGATNAQQGITLLAQAGNPGTATTGYPVIVSPAIQTNVATKIQIYNILGDATTGTPQNYTINDLAVYWEN